MFLGRAIFLGQFGVDAFVYLHSRLSQSVMDVGVAFPSLEGGGVLKYNSGMDDVGREVGKTIAL